ncbi:MAG TPA: hypothetical protein VM029_13985 [Opitutaceae bacterium]|nr:hypothetical protein [Opitutaceae bacterium]
MNRFHAVLFLSAILSSQAADKPLPVREEPYHKVIVENDYLRVIDVQIPPGKTTLYHTHEVASVIVYLTKSTNSSQTWGDTTGVLTPRSTSPGDSRYANYDEKALSHRVTNTGATLFRVLDIELLRPLPASVGFPANPPGGQTTWQEKRVRSSNIQVASGSWLGVGANECAHFLVITAGAMTANVGSQKGPSRDLAAQEFLFIPPNTAFRVAAASQKAEAVLLELK